MRFLYVVNPSAGGGKGAARWRDRRAQFLNAGAGDKERFTVRRGEAAEIASEGAAGGFDMIVAVGGDGTLNEIVNGVAASRSGRAATPRLGYIGTGSSNDFLRSIGDYRDARPLSTPVAADVVRLECDSATGQRVTRLFILNSSTGVISRAVEIFNRQSWMRRSLRYVTTDGAVLLAGLTAVLQCPRFDCKLTVDKESPLMRSLASLAVVKSPHVGGGMNYGTASSLNDGHFHVVGFDAMTRREMIRCLPKLYDGTILEHRQVWHKAGASALVEASSPVAVEADGELIGHLPARYEVLPEPLTIFI